jgi:hypothetical protein
VSFGLKAASKVMINPGLFHDRICHVPGLYCTIYRKILISNGAIPHIMITLAMPHKITAMFRQFFPHLLFVLRHYATTAIRSALK